jgi:hypothetical protein
MLGTILLTISILRLIVCHLVRKFLIDIPKDFSLQAFDESYKVYLLKLSSGVRKDSICYSLGTKFMGPQAIYGGTLASNLEVRDSLSFHFLSAY